MPSTVFWSWQSDRPARVTRDVIRDALCIAIGRLAADFDEAERPEIDHDTLNTPGSPEIVATIFEKIDESSVFVADVTPIAVSAEGKHIANPNVLIELGYAKKSLGPERVVLVWNPTFTSAEPEDLPFDMRHRRAPIKLNLAEDASRSALRQARENLTEKLEEALRLCIDNAPLRPKESQKSERQRTARPEIVANFVSEDGDILDKLDFERIVFEPLSVGEIDAFVERIREAFPIETDFGTAASTSRPPIPQDAIGRPFISEFISAKDTEISTYREKSYPDWLEECRKYFSELAGRITFLKFCPTLRVRVQNIGTQPATNTLVRFSSSSMVFLPSEPGTPLLKLAHTDQEIAAALPPLPDRPKAPRGYWKTSRFSDLTPLFSGPLSPAFDPSRNVRDYSELLSKRDPDRFYWKDDKPITPSNNMAMTCGNWRHGVDEQFFQFRLFPRVSTDNIYDEMVCRIHADNLTESITISCPVLVENTPHSTKDIAEYLLNSLLKNIN